MNFRIRISGYGLLDIDIWMWISEHGVTLDCHIVGSTKPTWIYKFGFMDMDWHVVGSIKQKDSEGLEGRVAASR